MITKDKISGKINRYKNSSLHPHQNSQNILCLFLNLFAISLHCPLTIFMVIYTPPVHLVESVENCGLCLRLYLACSSYANVMHRELAITSALRYDASARD